jgi:hypothetical protein
MDESDEDRQALPPQGHRKKPSPIVIASEEMADSMDVYRPASYDEKEIAQAKEHAKGVFGKEWAEISSVDIEEKLDALLRRLRPSIEGEALESLYREYARQSLWIDIAISERIHDEEERNHCAAKVYHLNTRFSQE